jgi:hypothetical protein
VSSERRTRKRVPKPSHPELRLNYEDAGGLRQVVVARLEDTSEGGIGVLVQAALPVGTVLSVKATATSATLAGEIPTRARVCWCTPAGQEGFRAGLRAEGPRYERAETAAPADEDPVDYYEILQVNPKADQDTIHRVYRLLAQRYHPDNLETGNEEQFKLVLKAFRVLSDPGERAAYDVRRNSAQRGRLRLFDKPESAQGIPAEKRLRQGLLAALYQRRRQQPQSPALTVFDFEEVLGVPRDHLEFSLWYLREQGWIARGDNNKFHITVKGVEQAEDSPESILNEMRLISAPEQKAV